MSDDRTSTQKLLARIKRFETLRHMLSHWLGWNTGHVVSALDDEGNVWIGFRCATCGAITGRHVARIASRETITAMCAAREAGE
jgi:hypothetical protein